MDEMDRAVGEAQAERAALVEAIEQAVDRLALGAVNGERGARRRGDGEPLAADGREPFAPPPAEPSGEGSGERVQEGGRVRRRAGERGEAGRRAIEAGR